MLEVYRGAYETARETLFNVCQKFDKTPPQDPGTDVTVPDAGPEEEDSNLSAVEKLRKRRRISGDQGEPRPRNRHIPAAELEIQSYEKLQVCHLENTLFFLFLSSI